MAFVAPEMFDQGPEGDAACCHWYEIEPAATPGKMGTIGGALPPIQMVEVSLRMAAWTELMATVSAKSSPLHPGVPMAVTR